MANLLKKARALPQEPGCYIMKNAAGAEIYVGKAKNLRRRVTSYFRARDRLAKEQALVENIAGFDYVVTESEVEALLLESRLIKDLRPRYNFLLRNNESYPYLEVTLTEDFPRAVVTRVHRKGKSRFFGPFASAGELRAALALLGRVFRFRTCSLKIRASDRKRRFARPCINFHIGRCTGPCAARVSREDYRRQIAGLMLFFRGRKHALVKALRRELAEAAESYRFERAAKLRDEIGALESIQNAPPLEEELAPAAPAIDPRAGLESLRQALGLEALPRRIEGIDIANLQGREMVGAVVTFLDALPCKDGYRRYRIKTVKAQDDFACMAEVVRRRYGRLKREGRELPDLILIDGGLGQVRAAEEVLRELKLAAPALLGLAKEEETPILASYGASTRGASPAAGKAPAKGKAHAETGTFEARGALPRRGSLAPLSRRSAGLKLLMYVRDEAHRFAQHYHHILRKKALFE
ncbi:MAG: excinuclease ABC subunit UvrC [Planctomycetota bacterium]